MRSLLLPFFSAGGFIVGGRRETGKGKRRFERVFVIELRIRSWQRKDTCMSRIRPKEGRKEESEQVLDKKDLDIGVEVSLSSLLSRGVSKVSVLALETLDSPFLIVEEEMRVA